MTRQSECYKLRSCPKATNPSFRCGVQLVWIKHFPHQGSDLLTHQRTVIFPERPRDSFGETVMAATKNKGNKQSTGVVADSAGTSRIAVQDAGVSGSSPLAETNRSLHQDPSKFQLLNLLMGILLVVLLAEWCWIVTRRPTPILIQRGADFRKAFRVEINSATWVEWMQLEGIGPALANRIVADRQVNGPFVSIEDLERVPGIGSGTLDRLRPSLILRHEQKTAQRNNQ